MGHAYPFSMDPYAVLGVQPGASPAEVARAYRAKAKDGTRTCAAPRTRCGAWR